MSRAPRFPDTSNRRLALPQRRRRAKVRACLIALRRTPRLARRTRRSVPGSSTHGRGEVVPSPGRRYRRGMAGQSVSLSAEEPSRINLFAEGLAATSGQSRSADAGRVPRASGRGLPEEARRHPRCPRVQLRGVRWPGPTARLGTGETRNRGWRHGGRHGAQRARDARGSLRRADGRGRPERPQLPARRPDHRVHPPARRRQAPDHGHRILRHRGRGARSAATTDSGRGHRRSPRRSGARRNAPGRDRLRGAPGRGRSGIRLAAARRRVADAGPPLHVGDDGEPERRRVLAPRRLPERPRQRARVRVDATLRVPVDPADVPLQRLDLPVGGDGGGRHPRVPPQGRSGADLPPDPSPRRHASLRGAGRAHRADPRAGGGAHPASTTWSRSRPAGPPRHQPSSRRWRPWGSA